MPITCEHTLTPLDRKAFGKLTYAVYAEVLAIRTELGQFFEERIYKQALAQTRPEVALEVPIWVSHGGFKKAFYLDALLAGGGDFDDTWGTAEREAAYYTLNKIPK